MTFLHSYFGSVWTSVSMYVLPVVNAVTLFCILSLNANHSLIGRGEVCYVTTPPPRPTKEGFTFVNKVISEWCPDLYAVGQATQKGTLKLVEVGRAIGDFQLLEGS